MKFKAALLIVFLPTFAIAAEPLWKVMQCSSTGSTQIGTASNTREQLTFWNHDTTIEICVSERSTQTCTDPPTTATDGAHFKGGSGISNEQTLSGSPAKFAHYCRAVSGTPYLNYKEVK